MNNRRPPAEPDIPDSEPELIAFAKHASQLTDGFVKPAGY